MSTFEVDIVVRGLQDYCGYDNEANADRLIYAIDAYAEVYTGKGNSPLVALDNHDDEGEVRLSFKLEAAARSSAITIAAAIVSTALTEMENSE